MADTKFGALVLILVLGFIVAVAPAALADGAQPTTVTNESITVDYQTESAVDETGVSYDSTVTIYNSTGTKLTAGDDYDWQAGVGNVTWYNTADSTDGEQATITYTVDQTTETSYKLAELMSLFRLPLALLILLALGAAGLLAVES